MAETSLIRVRIDKHLKKAAERVLAEMKLSLADAICLMPEYVAREKKLPFESMATNTNEIKCMSVKCKQCTV
jgi:addiction module RelB/DinJ family antitoxin